MYVVGIWASQRVKSNYASSGRSNLESEGCLNKKNIAGIAACEKDEREHAYKRTTNFYIT